MKKRRYVLGIMTVIIILIGASTVFFLMTKSCTRIACVSYVGKERYAVGEIYEEDPYIYRALYRSGGNMLRVEARYNVTAEEANNAEKVQIVRAKGVFEDAAAPYPGEISDVISCSNEYKPKYASRMVKGLKISLFDGYLNDRLVFGSCIASELKYKDTLAMFYCPNQKTFYQFEIITPKSDEAKSRGEVNNFLNSIQCK